MGKSSYLLIFLSIVVLNACQTSQNVDKLKTELQLTVMDENGKLLTGAVIAVFNNNATYLAKSPSYSTEGAVAVDTTFNGISVISTLNATDNYRVSVHYKDYNAYPGLFVDLDNNGANYNVLNKLYDGSLTSAKITLKPANGFVTFWTNSSNDLKLPIKVSFNEINTTSTITSSFGSQPIAGTTGATTIKLAKGAYRFNLISKTGCVYFDTVNISGGDSKYKKFESCNTGRLSFWAGQSLNSSLPITLILNNNDTLGVINSVFSFSPTDCYASNLLFTDYAPGNYFYTAISKSSQTVWSGKVAVTKDNCSLIEIK